MKVGTIQGILLGMLIGVAIGIDVYTFAYAKGWSYLTDDPAACANCHVMREQFEGWLKSSHRAVASCNSCHTPPNFLGKDVFRPRSKEHPEDETFPGLLLIQLEGAGLFRQCRADRGEDEGACR
jgi:nitrate/TMAO reductase-like tetraheme cytochrome c subunit